MPQGKLRLDLVAVPPAMSLAQHIALFDQLGEDPVGGAWVLSVTTANRASMAQ